MNNILTFTRGLQILTTIALGLLFFITGVAITFDESFNGESNDEQYLGK